MKNQLIRKENILINLIEIVSKLIGILTFSLAGIVLLYQFYMYLYDIQWFHYWNMDVTFYQIDSNNIINGLIYSCFVIFIILIFACSINIIGNNIKSDLKIFCYFSICCIIVSIPHLYSYWFNWYKIGWFIASILISFILLYSISKKFLTYYNNFMYGEKKYTLKDLLLFILILLLSIFITTVIFGNIYSHTKKEFKIISDNNICQTILYSSKDYYVVIDCYIDCDNLIVYRNTQRKIDNNNIKYEIREFVKIERR